jgi:hypothetical protein
MAEQDRFALHVPGAAGSDVHSIHDQPVTECRERQDVQDESAVFSARDPALTAERMMVNLVLSRLLHIRPRPKQSTVRRTDQLGARRRSLHFVFVMSSRPPVVAILNTNDDTVEMLRTMLETEGIVAVSAHVSDLRRAALDFGGFLAEHDPRVIIYDVPPPYDRSWLFFEHLRALPAMNGRRFVITSTNPARVQQVADPDQPILEIIGKPYDLQLIIEAVKKGLD